MVSQRIYLSVEGNDEVKEDTLVLSKTNASKINVKEGDEVIYEDVPGQIFGKARVLVSTSISNDVAVFNEDLYRKWSDKIQWFGTVEIRLSAEGVSEKPPEIKPQIPPEIPKFKPEEIPILKPTAPKPQPPLEIPKIVPKETVLPKPITIKPEIPARISEKATKETPPPEPEEDINLDNLLDSLIEEDLSRSNEIETGPKTVEPSPIIETKPSPPVILPKIKPTPPITQPPIKPLPPLEKPVIKLTTPVIQPQLKPTPPLEKPVIKPAIKPAPPLEKPVVKPAPPLEKPVIKPAPSLIKPELTSKPPIIQPQIKPAPPLEQPAVKPTPHLEQPEPKPISSLYETTQVQPTAVPKEIFKKIERPPEKECLKLKIELQYELGKKMLLSPKNYDFFGMDPFKPVPIIFEDPNSGSQGSATAEVGDIGDDIIRMEPDTYEAADIQSLDVIVFSSAPREPPIVKVDHLNLKIRITSKGIGSKVGLSKRNCLSLEVEEGTIVTFEDELIGAWGAGYVIKNETLPDNIIEIESEIFEATGIGSSQVVVRRNSKSVIPLQSLELGISPISGEDMWNTITVVRDNQDDMKSWLSQFLIFKGLKLRWKEANAAINILKTEPELKGEVIASPKMTSSLNLKAEGLITFNAILVIDISASMLAPDMPCTNVAPAIEGIKAAMDNVTVKQFLAQFREGKNMPRRLGAAFAALLFLAEKVGRGFGEKVSVIRFADVAEILDFGGPFFDSASGKHGILEKAAIEIVEKIGKYKGLATNMGDAMLKAKEVLDIYESIEKGKPCMLVILTDGNPTDEQKFVQVINQYFIGQPNTVTYIVGIGNTNVNLMNEIATRCGGEFFQPKNMGDLLIWYSKRARDLVVKLKGGRKYLNI